jgi:asparagine synthase (glutamine-hydrolysing)
MCGLVGFISEADGIGRSDSHDLVQRMASALSHRGPDDSGVWLDRDAGVALAHRRLAIVDLSPAGHQPMLSPSGRYVIVYNGEIYNFRSLKPDLLAVGVRFRGTSDTETLLAAIDAWGLPATLDRINGMFAFAVWDRRARILHLVRDRLGKKPLYFGWVGRDFLFASELKALHAHPDFVPDLDRDALALLLRYGYVPSPHSIYRGIFKLAPAGHLALPWNHQVIRDSALEKVRTYWSMREVARLGAAQPLKIRESEAIEHLEGLLTDAVEQRMIADVPLGAFLSGGIDSSTIVALMQTCSTRPVKTFTIGFHEAGYNEAEDAKQIAQHLGTDHHELYVTPRDAQEIIPQLPQIYDEPFADISQIPTFLVAQFTRRYVTVALSGDGGDEVFGGYNRHFIGPYLWQALSFCPRPIRRGCAGLMTSISPERWDRGIEFVNQWLPQWLRRPTPGYQLHRLALLLSIERPEQLYERLLSQWTNPDAIVIGGHESSSLHSNPGKRVEMDDFTHRMMYYDTIGYLPDDILVKVDRATMAVSLEARAPLLDHRVVEFAWRLPRAMKARRGQGKLILRKILGRHVPAGLVDRPKRGFAIPLDNWLRGPLRDWAAGMLDEERLRREGLVEPQQIRRLWEEHLTGKGNWVRPLWCVLMFQAWLEHWHTTPTQSSAAPFALAPRPNTAEPCLSDVGSAAGTALSTSEASL